MTALPAAFLPPLLRLVAKGGVVVALSLLLGGATSFGQTVLPAPIAPLANSASGWTLLTAVLVAVAGERGRASAIFGGLSFVALVVGYVIASTLRGFPDSESFFIVVGAFAGPVVGVAAAWLRRAGWRSAAGSGLLAGIATGEGAFGLLALQSTTGWAYWTVMAAAGPLLVGVVAVVRRAGIGSVLLAAAVLAVVATALLAAEALV